VMRSSTCGIGFVEFIGQRPECFTQVNRRLSEVHSGGVRKCSAQQREHRVAVPFGGSGTVVCCVRTSYRRAVFMCESAKYSL